MRCQCIVPVTDVQICRVKVACRMRGLHHGEHGRLSDRLDASCVVTHVAFGIDRRRLLLLLSVTRMFDRKTIFTVFIKHVRLSISM